MQELSRDAEFRSALVDNLGAEFQEELLVGFLMSEHRSHHMYIQRAKPWHDTYSDGASSIARSVDSPQGKAAVAKLGGTKRLVNLLKQYHKGAGAHMTKIAILHAILNLTTSEVNQVC